MKASEFRAVGDAAAAALSTGVAIARDLHLAVADRAFDAVGPAGTTVRVAHDGVARTLYGAAVALSRWVPRIAATAGSVAISSESAPLGATKRGNSALGAINGLWGDHLVAGGNELVIDMAVRVGGEDLEIDPAAVRDAFPASSGRLAVFVHGLCETDDSWQPSSDRQQSKGAVAFGEGVAELGFTPVFVRYNSGRRIFDSGARLSALLAGLVDAWPVPVGEIVLIGHSMGGLVARSACHHADENGESWVRLTSSLFGLGAPHLGAPLERVVNVAAWTLRKIPETKGFATLLNGRSVGVKDLRFGSLLEGDWNDVDPDGFLTGRAEAVPFLDHIDYFFIGATVTRNPRHPLGLVVGDLLVQYNSASATQRRSRSSFPIDNRHHIGGITHFDLLTHQDVFAQLERWLSR